MKLIHLITRREEVVQIGEKDLLVPASFFKLFQRANHLLVNELDQKSKAPERGLPI